MRELVFIFLCACSSSSVALDAGFDGAVDASDDAALDAGSPRCAVDGGGSLDPATLPAFGFFEGQGASGNVCLGGAFAVVDEAPTQTLFEIQTGDFGDPSSFFQFQSPASTTSGSLAIVIGLPSATVGTFTSDGACGTLELCAIGATPNVDCGDASAPTSCPPECDFVEVGGPCAPSAPETCFVAQGTSDCSDTPTSPIGSWELVLTSLTPYADDASSDVELAAHGVFRASLASADADAGTTTTLTLGF